MSTTTAPELVIQRTLDAPRDLVFRVWTQAEHLARWWGPKGAKIGIATCDVRPGGVFHYSMEMGGQGQTLWGIFHFEEVTPVERLVWLNGFADADGNPAGNPWLPTWPAKIRNVLTLEEVGGKTLLTMRGGPIDATPEEQEAFNGLMASMQAGWGGTFEQLDAILADLQQGDKANEITQRRVFPFPKALVFSAYTKPEHLAKWWGPNGFSTTTHEQDFRVGGQWRFTMHGPDGKDWPNDVRYLEIVENEKIVWAHGADDGGAPHFHATITFEERDGQTTLTMVSVFPSAEACEAVKAFGAVELGAQTLERLAAFLTTMTP